MARTVSVSFPSKLVDRLQELEGHVETWPEFLVFDKVGIKELARVALMFGIRHLEAKLEQQEYEESLDEISNSAPVSSHSVTEAFDRLEAVSENLEHPDDA